MKAVAFTLCTLLLASAASPQGPDMEHTPFAIGEINYFGYGGLPLEKIRAAVPWHPGDTLTFATFSRDPVQNAVVAVIGKPPTDVNITCCDNAKHLEIFIGLPGTTSHPVPTATAPSSTTHLDSAGLALLVQQEPLWRAAVARGAAGEDDSLGYMVSSDPALKAVNVRMRAYALHRETVLAQVLRTARDPVDRRAAAVLLGYTQRSQAQADALSEAVADPDDEVRNNAVRALAVLAAAEDGPHPVIGLQPVVNLLYSGRWTDRNKASLLLLRLTEKRDPAMLHALSAAALPALIEGARWRNVPGHSTPFQVVLGRIGGIPDAKLQDLLQHGNVDAIIAAASDARP